MGGARQSYERKVKKNRPVRTVMQAVKSAVSCNCCVHKISKETCKIKLTGVQPYILIDMDHKEAPGPPGSKKCDYLLVGVVDNLEWVVPLEMKSGELKTESFYQLEASAKIAESVTTQFNSDDFEFRPVVAFGGHSPKVARDFFKTHKITFKGEKVLVHQHPIQCGSKVRNPSDLRKVLVKR